MINKFFILFFCFAILSSCVASPPKKTTNICEIFSEKRSWYKAAIKTEKKWGSPAYVTLAFIKQELNCWDLFLGKEKVQPTDTHKRLMGPGIFIKNRQKNLLLLEEVSKILLIL